MRQDEPNPASAQEQAEGSRENVNVEPSRGEPSNERRPRRSRSEEEFEPHTDLPGKNDSGPEK